jgi:hypothetical protein
MRTAIVVTISQTASSGAWSFNTQKIDFGYLEYILCVAASGDTDFHFYIQDDTKDSNLIYDTRTEDGMATGTLRDTRVHIPLRGVHTVGVINSSEDEAFTGKLIIWEGV